MNVSFHNKCKIFREYIYYSCNRLFSGKNILSFHFLCYQNARMYLTIKKFNNINDRYL